MIRHPKSFLLIIFFVVPVFCCAQINFDNGSLKSLSQMATQCTYVLVKETTKGEGITSVSDTTDRNGNKLVMFSVKVGVRMHYLFSAKNKKLIYSRMDVPKIYFANFAPMFEELTQKGFEKTVTKRWAVTDKPMAVSYQHKDYPLEFFIYDVYDNVANIIIFNKEFGSLDNFELK